MNVVSILLKYFKKENKGQIQDFLFYLLKEQEAALLEGNINRSVQLNHCLETVCLQLDCIEFRYERVDYEIVQDYLKNRKIVEYYFKKRKKDF